MRSDALPMPALRTASEAGPERLAVLFDTHHQRLYRLARRLTSNVDDAKDLVQDTFLRAARSPGAVPGGTGSEEAWLVRVLVNLCRDRWRRRAAHGRRLAETLGAVHASPGSDHETAFIARTTVWRALDELPPRRRAVVVLHELEELDIRAIARLLGIAAVTARWHLSQGRRDLARVIRKGRTDDRLA